MCSQWPPGSACPQSAQAMRAVLFANATATNGGLISYGVDLADQYRQERHMSVLAASASDGSCKSAVSSWLRYRATLSSSCPRRRSTLARVKLRSIVDGLELAPVDGDAR